MKRINLWCDETYLGYYDVTPEHYETLVKKDLLYAAIQYWLIQDGFTRGFHFEVADI